jgi:putative transposase
MACLIRTIRHLALSAVMLCTLVITAARFLRLWLRSSAAIAAENLFLRQQLALYQARHIKPERATDATRCTLIWLSHWFDWRQALTVVQPETFFRWRRQGLRLFRRSQTKPGRPAIPPELQALIRHMARDNATWGQWRIANELQLKLGLRVSPRTVHKYIPSALSRNVIGHVVY